METIAQRRLKTVYANAALAAASAAISVGKGADVRIAAQGAACWVAQGDNTVVATDGAAAESLVPAGGSIEFNTGDNTYVSLRPLAAGSCAVSVGRWQNPGE